MNTEVHSKSFVSNFWGALHTERPGGFLLNHLLI